MKNGFSLIELLVVITIIGVLTSFGLANYNDQQGRKTLQQDTEKLVDILTLARKKTQANDISSYSCDNFNGYQMIVEPSGYTLNLCCELACDCFSPNVIIQQNHFNPGITSEQASGQVFIQFAPLNSTISSSVTLTLKNSRINNCQDIVVSASGTINSGNIYSCP